MNPLRESGLERDSVRLRWRHLPPAAQVVAVLLHVLVIVLLMLVIATGAAAVVWMIRHITP